MPSRSVQKGITASALCFAGLGLLLLFAAEELAELLDPGAGSHALLPLLGAAMLGFGAMNWIARGSALGGIYGRAIVAGNQTHLTIGAIALVKRLFDTTSTHPLPWVLAGLYVLGAVYFSYLTFFSSGIEKRA
jgi:hypothetical protein